MRLNQSKQAWTVLLCVQQKTHLGQQTGQRGGQTSGTSPCWWTKGYSHLTEDAPWKQGDGEMFLRVWTLQTLQIRGTYLNMFEQLRHYFILPGK